MTPFELTSAKLIWTDELSLEEMIRPVAELQEMSFNEMKGKNENAKVNDDGCNYLPFSWSVQFTEAFYHFEQKFDRPLYLDVLKCSECDGNYGVNLG